MDKKAFRTAHCIGIDIGGFDDTDAKGVATPLAEMRRLIDENPHNREAVFPYIGGEEVDASPTHAHHRHIINFHDWPLHRADLGTRWRDVDDKARREWLRAGVVPLDYPDPVAANWPELLTIVEEKVKPERLAQNDKVGKENGGGSCGQDQNSTLLSTGWTGCWRSRASVNKPHSRSCRKIWSTRHR